MIINLLHNLYDYSAWANARILDTAAQLTPDQLRAEQAQASASFGSVHGTLVHIMSTRGSGSRAGKALHPRRN